MLIAATTSAVAVAAISMTAGILYILPILGAVVGMGLMLEPNVMAQPPGDTCAEPLQPLAESKLARPGPEVTGRFDSEIVDATRV